VCSELWRGNYTMGPPRRKETEVIWPIWV
jgi:hypothetical protein